METEYPFHTAFLLYMITLVGVRMYFAGYADSKSGVRQTTKGEGIFRYIRFFLGGPLVIAYIAYMVWPPSMAWSQLELSPMIRWAGLDLLILGMIMLIWVQKHLSRNFTGTVQIRPGGHVVNTGPYKYVRHPMYHSFILLGAGMFLLTANWLLGGAFLFIIMIVIIVRTPVEEKALLNAYGKEYEEYMKSTGKFFPKL